MHELAFPLLVGLIAVALAFDFLNGLHDAANSIATVVATRLLTPVRAVLFAVLYNGPNWHRVALFASVVPITVFMNSFRIGMIGVLVNYFGISQAEGFLHIFEGWIIFIACTLVLYVEAWLLHRLFGGKSYPGHLLDIDFHGIIQPLRRFAALPSSRALVAASAVLIAAGAAWQLYPTVLVQPVQRQDFVSFPTTLGPWTGTPEALDESIEQVLRADDYFLTTYAAKGEAVSLFMTFYEKQTGGSGIHSPEVCLPSGGWEVSQWMQLSVPVAAGGNVEVNRALIRRGNSRQLVYYWFEQRGRRMTSDYTAKFLSIWDRMTIGRSDGGLVRFVTPLRPRESLADGDARLTRLINFVTPLLPSYFPPRDGSGQP